MKRGAKRDNNVSSRRCALLLQMYSRSRVTFALCELVMIKWTSMKQNIHTDTKTRPNLLIPTNILESSHLQSIKRT